MMGSPEQTTCLGDPYSECQEIMRRAPIKAQDEPLQFDEAPLCSVFNDNDDSSEWLRQPK